MLGRVFYYKSISWIGASRSDAIKASQPLHATLIAIFLLDEALTIIHFVGIVIIIVGVAAVSLETASTQKHNVSRKELLIGVVFPLGAAFFWLLSPRSRRLALEKGHLSLWGYPSKRSLLRLGSLPTFGGRERSRHSLTTGTGTCNGTSPRDSLTLRFLRSTTVD